MAVHANIAKTANIDEISSLLLLVGVVFGNKYEQYLSAIFKLWNIFAMTSWETNASQLYIVFFLSRSFLSVDIPGMEGAGEHA